MLCFSNKGRVFFKLIPVCVFLTFALFHLLEFLGVIVSGKMETDINGVADRWREESDGGE